MEAEKKDPGKEVACLVECTNNHLYFVNLYLNSEKTIRKDVFYPPQTPAVMDHIEGSVKRR